MSRKAKVLTGKNHSIWNEYKKCKYLFLLLIPVIVYFFIFHYLPMYGVIIAFKDFSPLKGIIRSDWIGLKHFRKLFSGMYFLPVLRNTLIISFSKLLFGFPAPIILCLVLNEVKSLRFKKAVQTVSYLPHFIGWVVLAGIVKEVFSPSHGLVNYIIQLFGGNPIFFVGSKQWFRPVIVGSSIWRNIGWDSIVYMAAIAGIDSQLYEAADLDGAGRMQKIRYITLPSLIPTIVIMFIFAVGGVMADDFDQIYNMLNAQVMDVGDVIGTYTYRVGLQQMDYGYATAVGLFKNVISLVLVTLCNKLSKTLSGSSLW
jgi:putative aldouronate transport system permease protein